MILKYSESVEFQQAGAVNFMKPTHADALLTIYFVKHYVRRFKPIYGRKL